MGGISSLIDNYYRHMAKDTEVVFHVVAIQTAYKQAYQEIFERLGIRVFFMPQAAAGRFVFLWKLIRAQRYDVVHAHVEMVSALYLSVSWLAGVHTRIAHTHLAGQSSGARNWLLKILLNTVLTHRAGCSKLAISRLFGHKYLDSATVIPNAVDPSDYNFDPALRAKVRQQLGISDRYVAGFVGRLTELKNLPYLLKIFKALKALESSALLLVVGDGELREQMEKNVRQGGLKDQVLFLGNRLDVKDLMMAMDVLLLPSFNEGFGLVLVEAQAASLKFIASSGRVPEQTAIIEGYAYYESIDDSPQRWAQRIIEKCMNYERKNMEFEIARKHFDVRIQAGRLVDFYKHALQKR